MSAPSAPEPTDQAVLDYLRKKGLGSAVLELTNLLDSKSSQDESTKSVKQRLETEEAVIRNQRALLTKSTGGSYGYDRDAAWPIVQWGVPDVGGASEKNSKIGVEEARAYLDAFTAIQTWVLSLPEDGRQLVDNPFKNAKNILDLQKRTYEVKDTFFNLPPSCKHELLAVCFALLTHTYCELLEVGMESTAHTLRDAFKSVYEPIYQEEYKDFYQCVTVEDIVRLNSHNSQHMEALSNLKSILVQVASYQLRREELHAQAALSNNAPAAREKIAEYDRNISILKQKYSELSARASAAFDKMHDVPFLRRARAVRWQLTLSSQTYGLLSSFFSSKDESLLAMSTLLQTKCELHIEKRDPLPFTPAVVFDESAGAGKKAFDINQVDINWAAPAIRQETTRETKPPFPKFHLEDEYEDDESAAQDKVVVEFNRALLVNGFRRLEAIERKREFESLPTTAQKRLKEGGTLTMANPLEPSILMSTLVASAAGPTLKTKTTVPRLIDASAIWDEAGIGLCCARSSPPDGKRVAVGCDDAAIRIYSQGESEPSQILLGHKNGFPVFGVDWNRDGRHLLSCGGDGSIRLWDTMAVGPFGEVADISKTVSSPSPMQGVTPIGGNKMDEAKTDATTTAGQDDANMNVPGVRPEDAPYTSGAALAVYRGHVPSSPVWACSFAPSGYYFASAGGDATARLWTTDRPTPVRLFVGHTSSNVNCVEWHPNCNYIVTGADDHTVRLWDIQSGRTVRLLDGCGAGINAVKISPGGRYCAGADYSGVVHLWDLGTGKKVTEFRTKIVSKTTVSTAKIINRLCFSACGSVLAAGGDDCCVNVWDVRPESLKEPVTTTPVKSFQTKQSLIMDLSFTRRNLLLSVGKYITPVPLANTEP